jgi:hypothetical protein
MLESLDRLTFFFSILHLRQGGLSFSAIRGRVWGRYVELYESSRDEPSGVTGKT